MTKQYLDKSGLTYFYGKLKDKLPTYQDYSTTQFFDTMSTGVYKVTASNLRLSYTTTYDSGGSKLFEDITVNKGDIIIIQRKGNPSSSSDDPKMYVGDFFSIQGHINVSYKITSITAESSYTYNWKENDSVIAKTSELVNDSDYQTAADVSSAISGKQDALNSLSTYDSTKYQTFVNNKSTLEWEDPILKPLNFILKMAEASGNPAYAGSYLENLDTGGYVVSYAPYTELHNLTQEPQLILLLISKYTNGGNRETINLQIKEGNLVYVHRVGTTTPSTAPDGSNYAIGDKITVIGEEIVTYELVDIRTVTELLSKYTLYDWKKLTNPIKVVTYNATDPTRNNVKVMFSGYSYYVINEEITLPYTDHATSTSTSIKFPAGTYAIGDVTKQISGALPTKTRFYFPNGNVYQLDYVTTSANNLTFTLLGNLITEPVTDYIHELPFTEVEVDGKTYLEAHQELIDTGTYIFKQVTTIQDHTDAAFDFVFSKYKDDSDANYIELYPGDKVSVYHVNSGTRSYATEAVGDYFIIDSPYNNATDMYKLTAIASNAKGKRTWTKTSTRLHGYKTIDDSVNSLLFTLSETSGQAALVTKDATVGNPTAGLGHPINVKYGDMFFGNASDTNAGRRHGDTYLDAENAKLYRIRQLTVSGQIQSVPVIAEPLILTAINASTAPASPVVGDYYMDDSKNIHYCNTAGTWETGRISAQPGKYLIKEGNTYKEYYYDGTNIYTGSSLHTTEPIKLLTYSNINNAHTICGTSLCRQASGTYIVDKQALGYPNVSFRFSMLKEDDYDGEDHTTNSISIELQDGDIVKIHREGTVASDNYSGYAVGDKCSISNLDGTLTYQIIKYESNKEVDPDFYTTTITWMDNKPGIAKMNNYLATYHYTSVVSIKYLTQSEFVSDAKVFVIEEPITLTYTDFNTQQSATFTFAAGDIIQGTWSDTVGGRANLTIHKTNGKVYKVNHLTASATTYAIEEVQPDYTNISGYSANATQYLTHDSSGNISWVTITNGNGVSY